MEFRKLLIFVILGLFLVGSGFCDDGILKITEVTWIDTVGYIKYNSDSSKWQYSEDKNTWKDVTSNNKNTKNNDIDSLLTGLSGKNQKEGYEYIKTEINKVEQYTGSLRITTESGKRFGAGHATYGNGFVRKINDISELGYVPPLTPPSINELMVEYSKITSEQDKAYAKIKLEERYEEECKNEMKNHKNCVNLRALISPTPANNEPNDDNSVAPNPVSSIGSNLNDIKAQTEIQTQAPPTTPPTTVITLEDLENALNKNEKVIISEDTSDLELLKINKKYAPESNKKYLYEAKALIRLTKIKKDPTLLEDDLKEAIDTNLIIITEYLEDDKFREICSASREKCQKDVLEEGLGLGENREIARDKIKELMISGDFKLNEAQIGDLVFSSGTLSEQKEFTLAYNDGSDCSSFFGSLGCLFTGKKNARQIEIQAMNQKLNQVSNEKKIIKYFDKTPEAERFCKEGESIADCQKEYETNCINAKTKGKNCDKAQMQMSYYSSYDKEKLGEINRAYTKAALEDLNINTYVNERKEYLDTTLKSNQERLKEIETELNGIDRSTIDDKTYESWIANLNEERKEIVNQNNKIVVETTSLNQADIDTKNENKKIEDACFELSQGCSDAILKSAYCTSGNNELCETVFRRVKDADKQKPVTVGWAFSIIDAIKNPDQSGLKAAKVFGFEANYENVPVMLRESLPSQMCLDKIDGYLDKEVETNGGVTKYNDQIGDLQVLGDLRAQRSTITPDNKTLVTYSYYVREAKDPFSLTVKYVENGNWKVFTLENSSKSKNMDSVLIPLENADKVEPNSFTINLNSGDLQLTYPIILISTSSLTSTIQSNGNAAGNEGANINANING